ncbi:hypothetical protein [Archangium lipolyticum]|uniref:hypothetical protein n=1 Tax=Archangium lipolyticum TaxID=2970465 RepID=UPI002149F214|nr:hypothetical protein [Archangium lipolyticum]
MSDARTLPPWLPVLKLLIGGQDVDPGKASREALRSGGLSHHVLGGHLQVKAVWTKLPSEV